MSSTTSAADRSGWKTIAFLILRVLLVLAFLGAAGFKLSGAAPAVTEFDQIGLGQWFRYFTAACELTGAVLLLLPTRVGLGATLLTCVCIGAFLAQPFVLHGDVIHTIVLSVVVGAIAWTHRSHVLGGSTVGVP